MNKRSLFFERIGGQFAVQKFCRFMANFSYIWISIFLLWFASWFAAWSTGWSIIVAIVLSFIAIAIFVALILIRPMNAVYGLMGVSGSILHFFWNFILITILFAFIYQNGFFRNAGICYDVNQPHIDFDLYVDSPREPKTIWADPSPERFFDIRTVNGETVCDTVWRFNRSELNYQPISIWFTWRNTILTALMQEPPEFFSVASTSNASMDSKNQLDQMKAALFQWLLIFQVLISWIFFGVFISLLYSKFRYES